jgi:hypothetical protein
MMCLALKNQSIERTNCAWLMLPIQARLQTSPALLVLLTWSWIPELLELRMLPIATAGALATHASRMTTVGAPTGTSWRTGPLHLTSIGPSLVLVVLIPQITSLLTLTQWKRLNLTTRPSMAPAQPQLLPIPMSALSTSSIPYINPSTQLTTSSMH